MLFLYIKWNMNPLINSSYNTPINMLWRKASFKPMQVNIIWPFRSIKKFVNSAIRIIHAYTYNRTKYQIPLMTCFRTKQLMMFNQTIMTDKSRMDVNRHNINFINRIRILALFSTKQFAKKWFILLAKLRHACIFLMKLQCFHFQSTS